MFKYLLFTALIVTYLCVVATNEDDKHAQLISSYNANDGQGHFKYGLDVSNGVEAKAEGNVNAIHGEYFLLNEQGEKIKVTYTADSTGFHPHIHDH